MMILGLSEVSKTRVTRSEPRDGSLCVQRDHSEHYYPLGKNAGSHYEIFMRWCPKTGPGGIFQSVTLGVADMYGGPWVVSGLFEMVCNGFEVL